MIFIEPTPYILGLIEEVAKQVEGKVDVLFIKENVSQDWNLSINDLDARILRASLPWVFVTLFRIISRGGYRAIHLAGWSEMPILFALFTGWLLRIPVVVESDTQLPERIPRWKGAIKRMFYPLLFRIPRMLLPGGSRQAAYFRHYGVQDERLMVAGMTVDVSAIMGKCAALGEAGRRDTRKNLGFSEDDVIFVFVGRLLEWKGVGNLLTSFDLLSSTHPNAGLVVAGDGPLRDKVASAAQRNKAIRYLGRLAPSEVVDLLHAGDVAVVPSHREPWGLVVNEAMAAGLPVVATDSVGCVDDLLVDDLTGKVVKPDDNDALVAAMGDMLQSMEKRERMGREALKTIGDWTLEREAGMIIKSWLGVTAS